MKRDVFGLARSAVARALAAAIVLTVPFASPTLAQGGPGHVNIPSAPTFPVPQSAPIAQTPSYPQAVLRPAAPTPLPAPQPASK